MVSLSTHSRIWRDNKYVYPVISRRSEGLSIGINLNPDRACSFDCVYCQVDRTTSLTFQKVDLDVLRTELDTMVGLAKTGELFRQLQFTYVGEPYRRFNDIAFSGDGEPTGSPQFLDAVMYAAEIREKYDLKTVKLVLITNSSHLSRPVVKDALSVLDRNNGEIWAKLDAGTEEHYRKVDRSRIPFATILENILEAARVRSIVIQSLWMTVDGSKPSMTEIDAFAQNLKAIIQAGGKIKLVQMHTVSRKPAEPWVSSLEEDILNTYSARVREVTGLLIKTYGA